MNEFIEAIKKLPGFSSAEITYHSIDNKVIVMAKFFNGIVARSEAHNTPLCYASVLDYLKEKAGE